MGERLVMIFTNKEKSFINAAIKYDASVDTLDLDKVKKIDLQNIADFAGLEFPHWLTSLDDYKVGRGSWSIPIIVGQRYSHDGTPIKSNSTPIESDYPVITDTPIAWDTGRN